MRWRATWPVLAALLLLTGPARAQNREILDLLPAQTLACVEVRQPDRLSREVLALVKGSAIEDLPATMARFRASLGEEMPFWLLGTLGEFTMFLSPELIAEAGRMQGGAVALTGIAKDGTPQIIGFLQAGDSHLPSFYMRAYMTFSNVLAIGEVEGVMMYRDRRRNWRKEAVQPRAAPPVADWEDSGPVMAQLPGLLVFGSTVDGVKDVVRRYKGKSAEPTLSSVRAYREAAALRERPGLFAYVDVEALAGQIEEAVKKQPAQAAVWNLWKAVLNPEALRNLTASLILHNGNLELQARLRLDGQKKSPLLELLPEKAAQLELLHYAPRKTLVSLTLDLSDGEQRWQKITQLIDAVAKVGGQSDLNLPSKGLKELEEKMNLRIGKDLFGRVAGAALVLVPGEKAGDVLPVLVVEGTEAAAAQFLQEKLPLLLSLGEEVAKPVRGEVVDGLEVFSLPAQGLLPGTKGLHYGRRGKVLMLGATSASVAAVARKDGLLAREKVAVALKDVDSPIVVGVASVGQLLVGAIQSLGMINEPRFEKVKPIRKDGEPPPRVEKPRPPKVADKVMQEVNQAVANLGPLLLTVQRQKGDLTLQVRQPGIRTLSVKLIDLWVETMLESFRERAKGKGGLGGFGEVGRAVEAAAADAERAAAAAKAKEAQQAAEDARRKAEEVRRQAEEERRKRERDGKP